MQPENAPDGRNMSLAERIRWARSNAELTQEQLRLEVGAGKGMPQKWELPEESPSHRKPTKEVIAAIAMATGTRQAWIESGDGEPWDPRKRELANRIRAVVMEHGQGTSIRGFEGAGRRRLENLTGVKDEMWARWSRTGPRNIKEAADLEHALIKIRNTSDGSRAAGLVFSHTNEIASEFKKISMEDRESLIYREDEGIRWVNIPIYNERVAAGAPYENDYYNHAQAAIRLGESYIRNTLGAPPESLAIFNVEGDSMEPAINDGDMIFVDTRPVEFINDGIYLILFEGGLMVKQLQRIPNGEIVVISRNSVYTPFTIRAENRDGFRPLGKVLGKCGRI